METEQLYISIGRLLEEQPRADQMNELLRWVGRAVALVEQVSKMDAVEIKAATSVRLHSDPWAVRDLTNAALYRALAVVELKAPVSAQGSFIQAGNALDAMAAVGKVMQLAATAVTIVDPYMDDKVLTDFAPLAKERVNIRLLSDSSTVKPTFSPAAARFKTQFGGSRPLEARLSAPRALHDRLIVVDDTTVYTVTQSLNALAGRSHASIVRVDPETSALKVAAYADIWNAASPT